MQKNAREQLLVSFLAFFFCLVSVQAFCDFHLKEESSAPSSGKRIPEYLPGEIIVKFKDLATENQIEAVNTLHGTHVLYTSLCAGFKRIKIPPGRSVPEMVRVYRKNPLVEYAEPNYIVHASWIPDDPKYSYQWHFPQINMPSAWDIEQGGDSSVIVAVLDTGVAYEDYGSYQEAPDLEGTNFVSGYDFVNDDSHPNDDHGHGTHVTGTIAQTTNNGIGVAGIAFNCSIMPVKVMNEDGEGTHGQVADGLRYAVNNGAEVINLSLGSYQGSITLHNAVKYAYNHDVVVVAAVGNDNQSSLNYPAAYEECIGVGAVRYDKTRAPYSNYGDGIEMMAPGGDTSVDQNEDGYGDGVLQQTFSSDPTNFNYYFWQGTSMAAPHISGVAALMLSHGTTGIENIRDILYATAEDLGSPGYDTEYGYGLVNAPGTLSPDLTITELTSTPNPSLSGEKVQITVEFANQGRVVGEDFRVDLYKNLSTAPTSGQTGDMVTFISGLSTGATGSTTFTCTYTIEGEKKVWAQIDTGCDVTEFDEGNNIYGPHIHEVIIEDTTPPSVSITSPLSGDAVSSAVSITASASDNVRVTRVKFYYNSALITTDTSSPWEASWDTEEVDDGAHTIKAVAYDEAENFASDKINVTVDNTPPIISNPYPEETISNATPLISASCEDTGTGISTGTAVMTVDGEDVTDAASVTSTGITYTPADALSEDTHSVTVNVKDEAGNAATQLAWNFTVDTTSPGVSITSPESGATVNATVAIKADVTDASSITSVKFYYDTTLIAEDTDVPYAASWDTTGVSDATYQLQAKAYDEAGNVGESDLVSVTVDNTAPAVSFTAYPTDPTSDVTPTFEVLAQDTITVTSVEYQVDGATWTSVSITPATSVTASFTTAELEDGSHTVKARAKDDLGNVTAEENYASYEFTVDTTAPEVSAATVSPDPVPTPTDSVTVSITVEFNESMATGVVPTVAFGKLSPYDAYSFTGTWVDDTNWEGTSSITPGVETGIYHVNVSEAEDVVGNLMAPATDVTTFAITTPQKKEKKIGKAGGTLELGDGTKVDIPAGALKETQLISIEIPTEVPEFGTPTYLTPTDVVRAFGPAGLVFLKLVTITIPYTDDDIAGLDEDYLTLYIWDGIEWDRVGGTVHPDVNTITIEVNHFSIFRIVEDKTPAPEEFKVSLSKNPFLSGEGTVFTYEIPEPGGTVTFKIYDASGDLVKTLLDGAHRPADRYSDVKWKGDNDFGSFVGSGLYIYKLEVQYDGGGSAKQIKTVGVIK